ncbi:hypothetical protein ACFWNT_26510 [Streptomyces sp. NPDC058409]|uniref:hypothetical protein n=1 Tax=Streptomyces sp. NPDC058409 TaxID=3346484 RepID=UPI0036689C1F
MMMATKAYELYGVPTAPEDPEQEYMTVQETAYILKCSVSWLRRFLRKHDALCGRNGRRGRIITNREQRAAIHATRSAGDTRTGRPVPRQSRPRRTAAKAPAAHSPSRSRPRDAARAQGGGASPPGAPRRQQAPGP